MDILQKSLEFGASAAAYLPVEKIQFEPSLIDLCRMNTCGNYGKCWTCPPLVGETEELIQRVKCYRTALVFQCIYPLEDSFDLEGMEAGRKEFQKLVRKIADYAYVNLNPVLILGAGGCSLCPSCAARRGQPCVSPKWALASLESYSIQVSSLAESCGLSYINGENTVTYFGTVLFDEKSDDKN